MRVSTLSTYQRVLSSLRASQLRGLRAQEEISTGKSLHRPSQDPAGTGRALHLRRQLSEIERNRDAIAHGRDALDLASSSLQEGSSLLIGARELILQAMNGTLAGGDRRAIGSEFDVLRGQMLDIANLSLGGRFLFGGTATDTPPFVEEVVDGRSRIVYRGTDQGQRIKAAPEVQLDVTTAGSEIFAPDEPMGVRFEGYTGLTVGFTASQGVGDFELEVRHDATDLMGATAVGLELVDGGAEDTLIGDHLLTIDATTNRARLGDGPDRAIPETGVLQLRGETGAVVNIDFSGWTGASYTGNVRGEGSLSLDGVDYTPFDRSEDDFELRDDSRDVVLHLNTSGITRSGSELVTFDGTLSLFDLMEGIAEDMKNSEGRPDSEVIQRLGQRLEDLDSAHEKLLVSLSGIGSRSQRLASTDTQRQEVELSLESLLSSVEDADLSEAALELAKADQAMQLAQAAGARLIQTTLLNFLG